MKKEWQKAFIGLAAVWAAWVSSTLVKIENEVAVMRYKLFNVAKKLPAEPQAGEPIFAEPVPFKRWLPKEKDK